MTLLYPAIKPYRIQHLKVDAVHTLYVEESGSPQGIPAVFLHGGPGGFCSPQNRQFFDPEIYRIILFDQRGCGQSKPHAELIGNTTQDLVADMETLRQALNIESWLTVGGSWGATLALVYAQTHPQRVRGLILRGVFLARQRDMDWFYRDGANRIFPDAWQRFLTFLPPPQRDNPVCAYYDILTGNNELARMAAAKAWARWENDCALLSLEPDSPSRSLDPFNALSLARIEAHYMQHKCFIEENQLLKRLPAVSHLPAVIIHGRYDMVCPFDQAQSLHTAWPGSVLHVPTAGHSASEPAIQAGIVRATKSIVARL